MGNLIKDMLAAWRPSVAPGRGDKYLGDHARELRRILAKSLAGSPLSQALNESSLMNLALSLVEMAEDLHNDIGMWRALEAANQEKFQTPLPFFVSPGGPAPSGFDALRFQYFLYIHLRHFLYVAKLAPRDEILRTTAEAVARYFKDQFPRLPADSGVKRFLAAPHDELGDIEGKLVWFGRQSYLIRSGFAALVSSLENVDHRNPLLARQFCVTVNTVWAGLTPAELLARALGLSAAERAEIAGWNRALFCHGREVSAAPKGPGCTEVVIHSLLDGRDHAALLLAESSQSTVGRLTRGPIVNWHGRRYWVNLQTEPYLCEHSPAELAAMRRGDLLGLGTRIFATFPELETPTRAKLKEFHAQFTARHGGDLAVFRTGQEAAEAWLEQQRFLAPAEDMPSLVEAGALLGHDLFECADGVAVLSEPEHGLSFAPHYDHVLSGLKKTITELSVDEIRAISAVLVNTKISPAMTQKIAATGGAKLLVDIMGLANEPEAFALDWLLGTFKGAFTDPGCIPNLCLLPAAAKE